MNWCFEVFFWIFFTTLAFDTDSVAQTERTFRKLFDMIESNAFRWPAADAFNIEFHEAIAIVSLAHIQIINFLCDRRCTWKHLIHTSSCIETLFTSNVSQNKMIDLQFFLPLIVRITLKNKTRPQVTNFFFFKTTANGLHLLSSIK